MLLAAAATAFFSCQKPEVIVPETSQEVTLPFASEKPAFDDETRTEWTGETIQWSKGDKISIAYTVDGNWQNANGNASGDAKLYKSDELTNSSEIAQFNVSTYFKGETEGTHVFYGVYPAPSETGFADAPVASLTISPIQNPKADSFDASADLMVGISDELGTRPGKDETISLLWNRLVAHAVITLKDINGLTVDETIKYITLTAQDDANLVGQQKVNLVTKEVVKDNNEANVLKLSADDLVVNNGTVTFWACFLPETLTSLTVVVETDAATYTREITGISKEFKRNARNTLAIRMNEAVRVETEADPYTVDVLTREVTGIEGTTYKDWSGKTLASGAVYAGQSAGSNESIQLRSTNSNSGVITTASGGYAKKVVVKWNSNTASGRTLNVYGNTIAYTSPTDLYDNQKSGVLLGTIKCGTSNELVIDGDYEYIGMRSASNPMYIEQISISWVPDQTPKIVVTETSKSIAAEGGELTFAYELKNLGEEDVTIIEESEFITAVAAGGTVTVTVAANETTEEREATITLSCGSAEAVILTVTQNGYVDPNAGGGESAEPVTLIIDGATLTTTATTADSDHNFGGITLTMSKGAKYQKSNNATNAFSDNPAIMIGKSGAYIYNKTPIPGRITKFEIYSNEGASAKVSIGVNFSSTKISEYNANASNTYKATLSTLNSIYDCSNSLPDNAQYFWYQVTNANNSQVQFRITYIPEN